MSIKVFLLTIAHMFLVSMWVDAGPRFRIIDIGRPMQNGSFYGPVALNDSGQVVGGWWVTSEDIRPFIWLPDSAYGLSPGFTFITGTLVDDWATSFGINNSGMVVGVKYTAPQNDGWFWHNGVLQRVDPRPVNPPFTGSSARAINNAGLVIGSMNTGTYVWGQGYIDHAFKGTPGNPVSLGAFADTLRSFAWALNNAGKVVGECALPNTAHAVLWDSGIRDLGTLGTPGDYSTARGINDSMEIVGWSTIGGSGEHAFLWKKGVMTRLWDNGQARAINNYGEIVGHMSGRAVYWVDSTTYDLNNLIDSATGWNLTNAYAINELGEIVGQGTYNGTYRTFVLRPLGLRITRPRRGFKWIAGTQDTIRWKGGEANQFVNLFLSVDSGMTFRDTIGVGAPGDSGYYAWKIPLEILSKKAMIRIHDQADSSNADTTKAFKIKGYILTRDSSGEYEPFRFNTDRWRFGNDSASMWPSSWYRQFNYQGGTDPNTDAPYPDVEPFRSAQSRNFPDWPLFVKAFGVNTCYWNPATQAYRFSALNLWGAIKKKRWAGSCSGFAISSLMGFSDSSSFRGRYTVIPQYGNLFSVQLDTSVRKVINELWIHWFGQQHKAFVTGASAKTPTQTVHDLKALLFEDSPVPAYLYFANNDTGGGAHAVTPYKLVQRENSPRFYEIHVYDNSYPTREDAVILVDTADQAGNGSWAGYANWSTWGGTRRLYLMDPVNTYLSNPILPASVESPTAPAAANTRTSSATDPITVFPSLDADIIITNPSGDAIGWVNNIMVDELPDALHLIPPTGSETPPYSYVLPLGSYDIVLDQFTDTTAGVFVFTESIVMAYERSNALISQTDRLRYDGSLSVGNPDAQTKQVRMKLLIIENTTAERLYEIEGLAIGQNDSLTVGRFNDNDLRIVNAGLSKSYDLRIEYFSATSRPRFWAPGIALGANSTHYVVPNWSDLQRPVPIYIDIGNNGTIDDTMLVNNTVSVDDQGSLFLPTEYNLAQNYPNPFNPNTTIRYALPHNSHVKLTIYNILGQAVATLVDQQQSAGHHAAEWNGKNDAGAFVGTGVFFYRLEARPLSVTGSYVNTKKMLMLR